MTSTTATERLSAFRTAMAEHAQALGRDEPNLVVITKYHPLSLLEELASSGQCDFGENRHPESRDKARAFEGAGITWHFVGQLQRKKARQVAAYADVLHSIDSVALVEALDGGEFPVRDALVQVNLTDDAARGGVRPEHLVELAERVAASPRLALRGVSAVAPLHADPRAAFAKLASYAELVRQIDPAADWISAGMSGDWQAAMEFGATHLRIGTAITGKRPAAT